MHDSIELPSHCLRPFPRTESGTPAAVAALALTQDPFRPTSNLVHPGTSTMRRSTINGVLLAPGPATSPMLTTRETAARAPLPRRNLNSFFDVHVVPLRRRPALPSSLPILALVQWRPASSAGTLSIFARRWNLLGGLCSGRRDGHVRAVVVSNPVTVFLYISEHPLLIVAWGRFPCMCMCMYIWGCSYGPLLLGIMLNILLYGVMITQTYLYFSMYRECVPPSRSRCARITLTYGGNSDRLWLKVFVSSINNDLDWGAWRSGLTASRTGARPVLL